MKNTIQDKRFALLLVASAYLLATMAALACVMLIQAHPLLELLAANVAATVIVFAFSFGTGNSSCYDPYWSVAPALVALWLAGLPGEAEPMRKTLVLLLVVIWSVRLTSNWAWGWRGLQDEDWRYIRLREHAGALWWPLSFFGIHLFPTTVVYLGCIALYPALSAGSEPLGLLDAVAALIGFSSVWLEFEADRQLHRFRADRTDRRQVLDRGVWHWCRHPNYLGEIGFWVSLFLFGWAGFGGLYPWSWTGPLAMVALFTGVSIPLIERKLEADKPGYVAYRRGRRALLPL